MWIGPVPLPYTPQQTALAPTAETSNDDTEEVNSCTVRTRDNVGYQKIYAHSKALFNHLMYVYSCTRTCSSLLQFSVHLKIKRTVLRWFYHVHVLLKKPCHYLTFECQVELLTHYLSICAIPQVIAHHSPLLVVAYLHTTHAFISTIHKTNFSRTAVVRNCKVVGILRSVELLFIACVLLIDRRLQHRTHALLMGTCLKFWTELNYHTEGVVH